MGKIQQFEHGAALRSPYMGLIHIGPCKWKFREKGLLRTYHTEISLEPFKYMQTNFLWEKNIFWHLDTFLDLTLFV